MASIFNVYPLRKKNESSIRDKEFKKLDVLHSFLFYKYFTIAITILNTAP